MSDQPFYQVEIHYDVRIPMRDGLALSANLFMPVPREPGLEKFPAIPGNDSLSQRRLALSV